MILKIKFLSVWQLIERQFYHINKMKFKTQWDHKWTCHTRILVEYWNQTRILITIFTEIFYLKKSQNFDSNCWQKKYFTHSEQKHSFFLRYAFSDQILKN